MDNTGSASEAYAKTLVIADNPYANAKEPEIEWSFDLPGYLNRCSPAVADDGTVYVGFNQVIREDQGPDFYAIKDGSLVWEQVFLEGSANKSDQVRSSPSIADDGSVYIGSYYSRTLYKVNGVNGIVDAQINVDARLRYFAPVFGSDGTVYFGGMSKSGKGFYAVDAGLNAQEWIYKGGTDFNSTPAIADDGTIYVGCTDGYISALNPDGTEKWTSEYGSWTASAIAIGPDGTVYFSGENLNGGIFIAYNPADGTEKWRKQLDEKATYGGPAIGPDGTIYLGSSTEKMIAYNADGTEKWTYTAKGEIQTVPAIGDDGNIYFGDANGFFSYS
jgi:outer membrane protein assembly factor BamB